MCEYVQKHTYTQHTVYKLNKAINKKLFKDKYMMITFEYL